MTQSIIFPFRRVSVDHMVHGTTRVWWQLDGAFNDAGPYSFQLQYGRTGLKDATDWKNVGAPVVNGYTALDPAWRESGYDKTIHYRVVLTTAQSVYVSQAANCFGELPEREWVLAREIIRKEQVRNRLVATSGYLIKPMRYGKLCKRCRDPLSKEVTDNSCPECSGTGFEIGFHPALAMQCWDLSPVSINEQIDNELKGTTRDQPYVNARVIGFPALNKYDIWVNGTSDDRWVVDTIQVVAALRGVPIIYQVRLGLLPYSNPVYLLEVGGEEVERQGPTLPMHGCGAVAVDQDYLGPDSLIYRPVDGCAVAGANIYAFRRADFEEYEFNINRTLAVGTSTTRVNGRWGNSIKLDPGAYTLLYEKVGEFGPDVYNLTVTAPETLKAAPPQPATPEAPEQCPQPTTKTGSTSSPTNVGFPSLKKQTKITGQEDFWNI